MGHRVRYLMGALLAVLWVTPVGAQSNGTIVGRVTDGTTHQPLEGVTVSVGDHGALTTPEGRYIIVGVPAGLYQFLAAQSVEHAKF